MAGVFGWFPVEKAAYDQCSKDIKAHVKTLNTALEGRKFLVGDSISIADVIVAMSLSMPFQTILDAGFRKAMGNCSNWADSVYKHPSVMKIMGQI